MEIKKFREFVNEEVVNDTPEQYIYVALTQLKKKIDKMFEFQENEVEIPEEETTRGKSIQKAREDSRKKSEFSFKDLGVRLDSSEISKYSKINDSLTVKFSDDTAMYNLYISIDIKDAIPKDDKDFSFDDIEKCYIKFKKYSNLTDDFEVLGQITKNVNIKDIDEQFLIDLKIEIDDKFGGDEEEFEIETE